MKLVDLPHTGRPSRLFWHKLRLYSLDRDCGIRSWTCEDPRIAANVDTKVMTDRAPTAVLHADARMFVL